MNGLRIHKRHTGDGVPMGMHVISRIVSTVLVVIMLMSSMANYELVYADAYSQVNVYIDYLEETATVTPGTGYSTKFYMSMDNKSWDIIDGKLDISTLLSSKEVTIYFKGNKDQNPKVVVLQGEDNSLKASFKIAAGTGRIEFITTLPVEFRNGTNGVWKTAVNMMPTAIYEVQGATLYFRTVATNAKRAGKIVTIKVPKRPSAPSIKLDGSKLCFSGLKVGQTQYRVGDNTNWETFLSGDTGAKTLDLSKLIGGNPSTNVAIPAGVVEFRTLGTDKKLTSAVKVIEIPQQAAAPELVNITGTTLTILDPDMKKNYEYTRVEVNTVFDMSTAKWSQVTSKNAVIIPKASVGDKIFVRVKSTTDKASKQVIPASAYKIFEIKSITVK